MGHVGRAYGKGESPVGAQPPGLGGPGSGLSTCKVPATAAKRAGREAGTKYSVSAEFPYFVQTREGYPRPVVRVLLLLQYCTRTVLPPLPTTVRGFTEVPVRLRTIAGRYPLASRSPPARVPRPEPTVRAHTALAGI